VKQGHAAPLRRQGTWSPRVRTVAFHGVEAVPVDVQVMVAPGKMGMHMLGRIYKFFDGSPSVFSLIEI
jgi:hypothetical protein